MKQRCPYGHTYKDRTKEKKSDKIYGKKKYKRKAEEKNKEEI